MTRTQHIVFPFNLENSQGGLTSAAHVTTRAPLPSGFEELVFQSPDRSDFREFGGRAVNPVEQAAAGSQLPVISWFRHDFAYQHLQANTDMLPADIARDVYRDRDIPNPGSLGYLTEFFRRYPVDFSHDEIHSRRFRTLLDQINPGDVVSIQGPVWLMPFLRENASEIKRRGAKLVYFEHQLVPNGLDQTPLGARLLPCYSTADVIFFHTSEYADRLANMLKGPLPEMRTVDLGIDTKWLDYAQENVREPSDMFGWERLNDQQQELITATLQARESKTHRFICFDRMDRMKGTHAVIMGIKLFLDEAKATGGEGYASRYHFAGIHELLNLSIREEDELDSLKQYIRVCKALYAQLQQDHPGLVFVCESLTGKHGHRDILPTLIRGSTVLALHGQDGLGLAALEGAYVNRDEDTGLIIGDQSGCYLEADRRGYGNLIHGVRAGDPVEIKKALQAVVQLRERSPGFLEENNARFVQKFVLPRKDTMMAE